MLIADEPTSHLDLGATAIVARLLRGLADDGLSVILVVHDLALAAAVADTVVVMAEGRSAATGTPRGRAHARAPERDLARRRRARRPRRAARELAPALMPRRNRRDPAPPPVSFQPPRAPARACETKERYATEAEARSIALMNAPRGRGAADHRRTTATSAAAGTSRRAVRTP